MTESQSVPDKHTPSRDETTPPSQLTESSVLPKNQGEGHAQSEAGSESGEPSESDAEDRSSDSDGDNRESPERIKKKARLEDTDRKEEDKQPSPVRYTAMSLYEERQLLKQLKALGSVVDADPRSNRFKRKLIVRQVCLLFQINYANVILWFGHLLQNTVVEIQKQSKHVLCCPNSHEATDCGLPPASLLLQEDTWLHCASISVLRTVMPAQLLNNT